MIYLIHGDDQVKSRQELQDTISRAKGTGITDIVRLDQKNIDLNILMQNMESGSMFGDIKRLVVIEDLHKLRSKTELSEIVTYLNSPEASNAHCILWESKELTALQQKKFPKAKIITTKVSQVIFQLTDALIPNQSISKILPILHSACQTESEELVLIMLARQIKMMIQTFDPNVKLPPWQAAKLSKAAKEFGLDKLITMHHELGKVDIRNKTGQLSSTMESELAFWFTKQYSK